MAPTAADSSVKHRACDECRTRKLACSKDPDGCVRCKRENIVCHYSEQKQMGRPRKRQFIETTNEPPVTTQGQPNESLSAPLNENLDIYSDGPAEPYFTNGLPTWGLPSEIIRPVPITGTAAEGVTKWHFGDKDVIGGPNINYGHIDFGPSDAANSSLDITPQLSAASNSSVTDSENSTHPTPPAAVGPCSCLASMYLSLASLQTMPVDIVAALRTVRSAASCAAQSIWCPQCGSVVLDNPNPPIESFQNTMLLGTILPIIANGYQRLLKMVDDETDAATAAGRTITFRFHDYGGMCGKQETVVESMVCLEKEMFFNAVEMPPIQWRTTVRALLRVDVYGHEQLGFKHKGLKDLVAEMEQRQRGRHELIDAHVAAGTMEHGVFGQRLCLGEQTHGCLQILKMAKHAIDSLVIA